MSSIFSDPFFRRGTTLLNGELIELDSAGNPVAGNEVVGQVKVFQDVNPVGRGERYSNRLVYCVAARYTGATVSDASTVAGSAYLFDTNAPLTNFSTLATATNAPGNAWGILDEYLTGPLRTNDIVWVVMKGPTKIKRTAAVIEAGAPVQFSATAGSVETMTTGNGAFGQQIEGVDTSSTAGLTRINVHNNRI